MKKKAIVAHVSSNIIPTSTSPNTFIVKIESIDSIRSHYKSGLHALGNYSKKIVPSDPHKCNGSVDIDTALMNWYPNSARWDYVLGYDDYAYFVEVHPATGSEVDVVIKKLLWLKEWLSTSGMPLKQVQAPLPFHWISSGAVKVLKGSGHYRKAQKLGIVPRSSLHLQ